MITGPYQNGAGEAVEELQGLRTSGERVAATRARVVSRRLAITLAIVLTLGGLGVRLSGLESRVYSHPENFAPGLDVPDWLRFPPDRLTLSEVLRSTMIDGHPPTYFIALLPWVKAFGTGLWSLRVPSALLGAACIWLLFLVARRQTDDITALVAAGLLSIHGYAIYWSQMARMYAMVTFLGLLSTLFLLRALEHGRRRDFLGYFLTTSLALWTQLYAWPLVAAQVAWCALRAASQPRCRTMLRVAILSIAASAPVAQLSMRQNPATDWQEFSRGYYEFGYLFSKLYFWKTVPWVPTGSWVLIGCVGLIALGTLSRGWSTISSAAADPPEPWSRTWDWLIATAVSSLMFVLAWRWFGGGPAIWAISVIPIGLVALTNHITTISAGLGERFPQISTLGSRLPLPAVLAILPMILMTVVSMLRGVLVARGTVVFLPFLLLLVAQGLTTLILGDRWWRRALGSLALGAVVALFVISILRVRQAIGSPRDYASVGRELSQVVRPGDLILVRNDYVLPPMFYYLDRSFDSHLVHEDHALAIEAAAPTANIWLVQTCPDRGALQYPGLERLEYNDRRSFIGIELWRYQRPGIGVRAEQPSDCALKATRN